MKSGRTRQAKDGAAIGFIALLDTQEQALSGCSESFRFAAELHGWSAAFSCVVQNGLNASSIAHDSGTVQALVLASAATESGVSAMAYGILVRSASICLIIRYEKYSEFDALSGCRLLGRAA